MCNKLHKIVGLSKFNGKILKLLSVFDIGT